MGISPEVDLVIAACRRTFPGAAPEPISRLGNIDWDQFIRLVRFHRVQGLVHFGLEGSGAELPSGIAGDLANDASEIAAANLRSASECRELLHRFGKAAVDILFIKGLTLGALAYRKIALKASADIDIAVSPDQIGEAAGQLAGLGYQLVSPAIQPNGSAIRQWHSRCKESLWRNQSSGLYLDLHTRLSDSPRLIAAIDIESPRQQVEVAPGITLPTLARDELFAYLCVHGGSSAWFRLKWITDLAAWMTTFAADEIERLCKRSQELGAGRSAALALLVADELYGTLANSPLRLELGRQRLASRLAGDTLRQLGKADPREPTAIALGTWRIHLTQLLLVPGAGGKVAELARQARQALLRAR